MEIIALSLPIRYYRLAAGWITDGPLLVLVNGVAVLDGVAVLGQVCADPDTGAFIVAPILAADGTPVIAPPGWEADILPDPVPPPLGGGRAPVPFRRCVDTFPSLVVGVGA